jgi:hypothetical protein
MMGRKCYANSAFGNMDGNTCTNCARTIWVLKLQCIERGNFTIRKKTGNIGMEDGIVGNAHNAGFFSKGEG